MEDFMVNHALFPISRAIVFDIGNVLVTTDLEGFFDRLQKIFPEDDAFTKALQWLDINDGLGLYELGLMTTQELLQEIHAELGIDHDSFIDLWNHMFVERSYILPFLKELREQGYTLAVCSNTNEIHVKYLLHTFCCFDLIDHFIFSYKVHANKPSSTIYRAVEEVTEKTSCEHLFLDDLVENVEGALAVGWDAIHFQDPEQVQVELFTRGLQFTPWFE
jgi:FMN phosphatase YigB (HAD superfamily)